MIKAGDRVMVYGHRGQPSFKATVLKFVEGVNGVNGGENGFMVVDARGCHSMPHVKQCRKLVKRRQEIWVNPLMLPDATAPHATSATVSTRPREDWVRFVRAKDE